MGHRDPNLDAALREAGMSQRELARRLGYHPNTVNRWQKAPKPALAYLRLYAEAQKGLRELMRRRRNHAG